MIVSDAAALVQAAGVVFGFFALWRSNKRLSTSLRLNTLQQMVVEMNRLRALRAAEPSLERILFPNRQAWSDEKIKSHLIAVQLANIFEWAYLARRDRLLAKDVWDSWVETWRSVILSSDTIKASFNDVVWTFGRSPDMLRVLNQLVTTSDPIGDPARSDASLWDTLLGHV